MTSIKELEKKIQYHKALYYQGFPEISDVEYDKLEDQLRELDPKNHVLHLVGHISKSASKVKHDKKMLSLNKTYKLDELVNWMGNREIVSTIKIDGVSCSLIYEDGELVMGKTRGNGSVGEDITTKVMWVNEIPKVVNKRKRFEVRGELFCTEEKFIHLAETMQKMNLEKPTSQRNIVAGLLGRKDNVSLAKYLNFQAFDQLEERPDYSTEMEKAKNLKELGFSIPEIILHKSEKTLKKVIDKTQKFISEGDYQVDGLVFSYNDLNLHDQMGETAHHPRYKLAYKFEGTTKITKVNEIEWSISRNGIFTPVALVEPVELAGAMISRVTLHNYGMVKQFEIKPGDEIEIIRSGEVIPKFLEVKKSSKGKLKLPSQCPYCHGEINEVDIRLYCQNKKCPGRLKESVLNFVSKIGIDDLSSKRIEEMMKKGLIKEISSLYDITVENLLMLDKTKEKLANKLYGSIQKSKQVDFITFLSALGISGGAYNKCEKIVNSGHDTLEKIKKLTIESLSEVESFAEKSSTEFIKSLQSKMPLIEELERHGFNYNKSSSTKTDGIFSGKKVCITGSLSEKRSVVEANIRENGGNVVSSVSKTTDYLLTNDANSGSSKAKKAKSLNIPIISEKEFFAMIN